MDNTADVSISEASKVFAYHAFVSQVDSHVHQTHALHLFSHSSCNRQKFSRSASIFYEISSKFDDQAQAESVTEQ